VKVQVLDRLPGCFPIVDADVIAVRGHLWGQVLPSYLLSYIRIFPKIITALKSIDEKQSQKYQTPGPDPTVCPTFGIAGGHLISLF
jgi:hypothetical protein